VDLVIKGCSTSDREDVKPQIRKEDGIIFEDLLEKLKRNRDELSSVEVVILMELYQMRRL